jgi:hypothetical protein
MMMMNTTCSKPESPLYTCNEILDGQFRDYTAIHVVLMVVTWGVLMPGAICFAHFCRRSPHWFPLMRAAGVLSFLLSTAAIIIIFVRNASTSTLVHSAFGMVLFVFSVLQVVVAVCRPAAHQVLAHARFSLFHRGLGYALAVATYAFMGGGIGTIRRYYGDDAAWVIFTQVCFYAIGLPLYALTFAALGLEWYRRRSHLEPPAWVKQQPLA